MSCQAQSSPSMANAIPSGPEKPQNPSPKRNFNWLEAQNPSPKRNFNWLVRYKYRKPKDPHKDMRNVLLVVSALIAAVTFQAGVNPPGGVWQDENTNPKTGHKAGSAIYASHMKPFYVFLVFNTLALSSSLSVIISLTFMFPFSVEIWIATISMIVTYGSAVFAITPHEDGDYKFRYLLITAAFPLVARVGAEIFWCVKDKFKDKFFPKVKIVDINLWKLVCWNRKGNTEADRAETANCEIDP